MRIQKARDGAQEKSSKDTHYGGRDRAGETLRGRAFAGSKGASVARHGLQMVNACCRACGGGDFPADSNTAAR